ncbi:MAG: hypothetical protein OXR66_07820 [Candidatus Woesearchaeota archaeon]|nr:hypothetical protein [Candidatus Woesearchaeota archaeon]
MFWLFRSGKALIHDAAVKAHHAEVAFRGVSKDLHRICYSLQDVNNALPEVPKQLGRDTYKTIRKFERYSKLLKRHTATLKKQILELEREAKKHT